MAPEPSLARPPALRAQCRCLGQPGRSAGAFLQGVRCFLSPSQIRGSRWPGCPSLGLCPGAQGLSADNGTRESTLEAWALGSSAQPGGPLGSAASEPLPQQQTRPAGAQAASFTPPRGPSPGQGPCPCTRTTRCRCTVQVAPMAWSVEVPGKGMGGAGAGGPGVQASPQLPGFAGPLPPLRGLCLCLTCVWTPVSHVGRGSLPIAPPIFTVPKPGHFPGAGREAPAPVSGRTVQARSR